MEDHPMFKHSSASLLRGIAAAAVVATGVLASPAAHAAPKLQKVSMMVGGIDKQIYLPYQLAQDLGFFKKYGIDMVLSTEQEGGIGAETAMVSGQVDMAGAWYVHTIDFQMHGKNVIDIAQLSGAPGERIMCGKGTHIKTPADWKGKSVGVTDLGSGTDDLTLYLATRYHLTTQEYHRIGVGAGETLISALEHHRIVCGMTTQPTVNAIETMGIGHSTIDLATSAGVNKWLGGFWPAASVLARASWVKKHPVRTQHVVDAMVATMHWIATHSAADIADHLPKDFVSSPLSTKAAYIKALNEDKGQFLPDGRMPKDGPQKVFDVEKLAGKIIKPVNLTITYSNVYADKANQLEGFTK
ncbi:MAG: ABC transporter substrate-binding protein [Acidiphilium sp. 37-64-53]|jgi:NitT/TauT family transport system substrate-binding protein|uniref:ABC transporter substrate-binding protein n=2 Tax=Acidocellaceae TaxID=3385905 RepID=UPI000BD6F77D|nr:ABC transporter substrate-binding protein [Acidiphilium sp. 34-64-41]OYW01351.1 MAG: ABC transporter substrate-binding protein [Acidiphilium sp. 37-64-53]OZB24456.1 MAG: ABC transporter substrate-binding protein [Acidiphilium sp. 34-64-41]